MSNGSESSRTAYPSLPDWQLPVGVSRGLWDYLHDPDLADAYDARLAGSALFQADMAFATRHFDRPGRLVDLGCGTGRLLVEFAGRGFWGLGVDLSDEMLRVAARKAREAGVHVRLVKANLVELSGIGDASFDYAACLFSTLGMIGGAENRQRFVSHVHRLLRPGGRFVVHVHNRWFNFWDPQARRWLLKNLLLSWLGWETGGDHLMPVHQGVAGLSLHLFRRREILRMLKEAGFRLLEIQPVGLDADGTLACPRVLPWLRSYGYLLAAERLA